MVTKGDVQASAQKIQQGVKKHLAKMKSITFGGQSYKPSDITTALQSVIDTATDADTKKAAYHAAVETQNKAAATAQPLMLGVSSYVYLTYGNSNEVLADFGLSPRKKRAPTVKTKAGAIVKAAATREARGTKGKRQKEEIVATAPATTPPASGVTSSGVAAAPQAPAKPTGSGS
jgi:hypothetical protein